MLLKNAVFISLTLYVILIAFYVFADDVFFTHVEGFWDHYNKNITGFTSLMIGLWALKGYNPIYKVDIACILFFVIFRALQLLMYELSIYFNFQLWMTGHVKFWIMFLVASYTAFSFKYKKHHYA